MITQIKDTRENITWTAPGLRLEACSPFADRFMVTVREIDGSGVLWDGEFPAEGRTLNDLTADDFTQEVLARIVCEQATRLGDFVYTQDQVRCAVRDFAAALPESFRP
jgi:hypothetical protein